MSLRERCGPCFAETWFPKWTWRCSALYQRTSPNRPGNEGWYFKVLN